MRRRQPDRVPFDLSFGIAPCQLDQLVRRTGSADPVEYFGADTRMLTIGPTRVQADLSGYLGDLPPNVTIDEWGVGHKPTGSAAPAHAHLEGFIHPMAALESGGEALDYPLPDVDAEYRYGSLASEIRAVQSRGLAALATMTSTIFEQAWYLRGMERLLVDFVENAEFAIALLDRITLLRRVQAAQYAALGPDVITFGDDVGTQRAMLMSPDMWRRWLKPRLASVIAAARSVHPDVLIFFHSDGNIRPIIPDLIEIGVDILNPVQPECMDPADLKRRFGDRLSFWGTIGTQTTFPFGTTDDVRREVRTRAETVGKGGGLFLAPTHYLEPEVPFENIVAFVEAVKETGRL
jgi:uroporphyrinogen decarboxylase